MGPATPNVALLYQADMRLEVSMGDDILGETYSQQQRMALYDQC